MAPSNYDENACRHVKEVHRPTAVAHPKPNLKSNIEEEEISPNMRNKGSNDTMSDHERKKEKLPDQQVGQVITKTKKAAESLWLILHAQVSQ